MWTAFVCTATVEQSDIHRSATQTRARTALRRTDRWVSQCCHQEVRVRGVRACVCGLWLGGLYLHVIGMLSAMHVIVCMSAAVTDWLASLGWRKGDNSTAVAYHFVHDWIDAEFQFSANVCHFHVSHCHRMRPSSLSLFWWNINYNNNNTNNICNCLLF